MLFMIYFCSPPQGMKTHFLYILNGLAILSSWTVARLATFPPFFLLVWRQRGSIKDMHPASAFLRECTATVM